VSYDSIEATSAEGRPFFLYQFAQDAQVWRFTSRASDWIDPSDVLWQAAAISHGNVVQTSEIERGALEVTFPLSQPFARRYIGGTGNSPTTLTVFRGHEQLPLETVAHWKGRVSGAATEGQRIILSCESLFTSLRRAGVRAKYQRLCRHALFGRGCNLDMNLHLVAAEAQIVSGTTITVPQAALQPDGWYRGGVLVFGAALGFILDHANDALLLSAPMPELAAAVATPELDPITGEPLPVMIAIAPGCDLRAVTCETKFSNLDNFGGFPEIPGRNPFGGGSII